MGGSYWLLLLAMFVGMVIGSFDVFYVVWLEKNVKRMLAVARLAKYLYQNARLET